MFIVEEKEIKEREEYHKILVATSRSALNIYIQTKDIDPTVVEYQKGVVRMHENSLKQFYLKHGIEKNVN